MVDGDRLTVRERSNGCQSRIFLFFARRMTHHSFGWIGLLRQIRNEDTGHTKTPITPVFDSNGE